MSLRCLHGEGGQLQSRIHVPSESLPHDGTDAAALGHCLWKASLPSSMAAGVSQEDKLQLRLPSVAVRLARQEQTIVGNCDEAFCQSTGNCAHGLPRSGIPAGADAMLSRCRHSGCYCSCARSGAVSAGSGAAWAALLLGTLLPS